LSGRSWDAALDTSGYFPRIVRASSEALAESVSRYVFVSTLSVYADLSRPVTESSPLATIEDETTEDFGPDFENYGPLKALCERAVTDVFGERALIVRPGFIVGPHDPTDRFAYWLRRAERGARMLAPGPPGRPFQFVDVRDLTSWMLQMLEESAAGPFNATNQGVPLEELLAGADVVWVPDEFLVEHGVTEEDLPLWSPDPKFSALHEADVSAAVAAGLTFRPVQDTVKDTLEWDRSRGDGGPSPGLSHEREEELMAAWERG
jgi:2'-hydroxyisoflavone reductase